MTEFGQINTESEKDDFIVAPSDTPLTYLTGATPRDHPADNLLGLCGFKGGFDSDGAAWRLSLWRPALLPGAQRGRKAGS